MDLVRTGAKRSTVRAGLRGVHPGAAELVSGQDRIPVAVTKVESKFFGALDDEDATTDGFDNAQSLKETLLRFYPDLTDASPVTIVYFDPA